MSFRHMTISCYSLSMYFKDFISYTDAVIRESQYMYVYHPKSNKSAHKANLQVRYLHHNCKGKYLKFFFVMQKNVPILAFFQIVLNDMIGSKLYLLYVLYIFQN